MAEDVHDRPHTGSGEYGFRLDVPAGVTEARKRELLEGPIRAVEFHNHGYLVLHGSCCSMGHRLLTVVGQSGSGKSTLATTLCHRGATLISDGMTVVHPETLDVPRGPPRTKLNDESLRMLGQDPMQFELVHSESSKRYFPIASWSKSNAESMSTCRLEVPAERSTGGSLPLRESLRLQLILIVEDAEETEIVTIAGARSLMALIRNTYLIEHLPSEYSPILMQRAAAIIQRGVQVKALRRKKEPGQLTAIAECIEKAVSELE